VTALKFNKAVLALFDGMQGRGLACAFLEPILKPKFDGEIVKGACTTRKPWSVVGWREERNGDMALLGGDSPRSEFE
jgi:hypothetical protein